MTDILLSKREQLFLDLLAASLNQSVCPTITEDEEIAFAYDAGKADVLSLVYPVSVKFNNLKWKAISQKSCEKTVANYYRYFFVTRNILYILEKNGIDACVIKGVDLAEYYPVPEYRSSSDVDILLKDAQQIKTAVEVLLQNGYCLQNEEYSPHHANMVHSTGVIVEIHNCIMRPFENETVNKKIEDIFSSDNLLFELKTIMGCDIKTLPGSKKAFYMLIHMLEHYLAAGFGVRLLCDWVLFWNDEESLKYADEYLKDVTSCGMKTFSDMVTYICIGQLGLKEEHAFVLLDKEICNDDTFVQKATSLLNDILEAGRFGEESGARLVNTTSPSLWGLFKEFHHQARINFPKASKIFITWPILWIASLFIFMKNNKYKRGVKSIDVIRSAHKRAELTKYMNLWH